MVSLLSDLPPHYRSFLDLQPDTASLPIIGPALRIGGELLKWEGPPAGLNGSKVHSGRQEGRRGHDLEPVDLRVIFESAVGEMTTSHLEMENCGTTAIYYSWQVCSALERRGISLLPVKKHAYTLLDG